MSSPVASHQAEVTDWLVDNGFMTRDETKRTKRIVVDFTVGNVVMVYKTEFGTDRMYKVSEEPPWSIQVERIRAPWWRRLWTRFRR